MSHYLVTGGAGFIGSHLTDALLAAGHRVTVIDDLSSGIRGNVAGQATFVQGNCGDTSLICPLIDAVDGVFHLAAIASVQRSQEDWLNTSRTNSLATIALLDAISKRAAPIPFVYASSAAIYGNPSVSPITESVAAAPLTPYGADKYACELHASAARHVFGIPTLGLRFFNVYGLRQDPSSPYSGVISIFMDRIGKGDSVTIFGDGEQTRDFVYVGDVVAHLAAAMDLLHRSIPAAAALNVCLGEAVSIRQLAEQIATLFQRDAVIQSAAARAGDIRHSLGDASLTTATLGVRATTLLTAGLRQMLTPA